MRRSGGALLLAAAVACGELRTASPVTDAGAPDGSAPPSNDAGPAADATPKADAGRPPCPAPCTPQRLSDLENLGPLAIDSFNVYFASASTGVGVFQCPKDGCGDVTMKLGPQRPTRIAVADNRVFWAEDDDLYACARSGCSGIPHGVVKGQIGIDEVMSDGVDVVWHAHEGTTDVIRKCPANNCIEGTVEDVATILAPRAIMALGDRKVFWVDYESELRFCPLSPLPCLSPTLVAPGRSNVAVYGNAIYWVNEEDVVTCPLTGCAGLPRKIGSTPSPHLLAIDEYDVYWREMVDNKVVRCPLGGCTGEPETIATDVTGSFYGGLALDAEHVYWTSKAGLFRRHK